MKALNLQSVELMSKIKHYNIGRNTINHYAISDSSVSRLHAKLFISANAEYLLVDCASTSGTYVMDDGQWRSIHQEIVIPSQQIKFGKAVTSVVAILAGCIKNSNKLGYPPEESAQHKSDALPEGPVRRNVSTGEVVEKG